jgi:hypothetical protein
VDSFLNRKRALVPVEVQSQSYPTRDTQMIRFELDNVQPEVDIEHKSGHPEAVRVVIIH